MVLKGNRGVTSKIFNNFISQQKGKLKSQNHSIIFNGNEEIHPQNENSITYVLYLIRFVSEQHQCRCFFCCYYYLMINSSLVNDARKKKRCRFLKKNSIGGIITCAEMFEEHES